MTAGACSFPSRTRTRDPTHSSVVEDVIQFYFALGDATMLSVDKTLIVGGRGFQNSDWTVDASAGNYRVKLVYQSADRVWQALDSVGVSIQVQPPTYATVGVVVLRIPTDGRYTGQEWQTTPPVVSCSSYGQTPVVGSHCSNVLMDRFLTFDVEPLIRLTPKLPRSVRPTELPVPPL